MQIYLCLFLLSGARALILHGGRISTRFAVLTQARAQARAMADDAGDDLFEQNRQRALGELKKAGQQLVPAFARATGLD